MQEPEFLSWRGNRIHTRDTGSGEPLLLLGGLGCDADSWAPFVRELTGRRILCFDAPGTGSSSSSLLPVSISSLADLAAAVLDRYDVAAADVVGFSYGGAVAQQLAIDHPERIRRLVLAATTCGWGAVPGPLQAMAVFAHSLRLYSPAYFERVAATLYGGVTSRDAGSRAHEGARHAANLQASYGYAMQLLGAAGWTSLPYLGRIPHETLVINGDDDPLVPVVNAELLARRIPQIGRAHV